MNIIILLGGKGQRFKDEHYMRPKPLINIAGRPLIRYLLDSLHLMPEDKLHLVYQQSLDRHGFSSVVSSSQVSVRMHPIHVATRGPAETALCLLNQLPEQELSLPTLTLDGDTIYETDILAAFRANPTNMVFFHETEEILPLFSYIQRASSGQVQRIREKERISTHACTGAYGFESGSLLRQYITTLLQTPIEHEYYMSSVYQTMLNDSVSVRSLEIQRFNCLGTPKQVCHFIRTLGRSSVTLRVCFDLDETLVSRPQVPGDYSTVLPLEENIAVCRELKRLGHTIIIHTARRMLTHGGNVGKVTADIGRVTLESLEKLQIPFDEIYFGKPFADLYVDDKAINAMYHLDREIGIYVDRNAEELPMETLPPRSFNRVDIQGDTVIKTSQYITGEIYWYQNMPASLAGFFPRLVEATSTSLCIEYIPGPTWSHLLVNGALTTLDIDKLWAAMKQIHATESGENQPVNIYANYAEKLETRFQDHHQLYQDLEGEVLFERLVHYLRQYEYNQRGKAAVVHGDPVFTNIIASRKGGFKLIDMRGSLGDTLTLRGDAMYDYAKIYQSLCGYDSVLHQISPQPEYMARLRQHFESHVEASDDLRMITASLFFSMIPMHQKEAHQRRFMAMAHELSRGIT